MSNPVIIVQTAKILILPINVLSKFRLIWRVMITSSFYSLKLSSFKVDPSKILPMDIPISKCQVNSTLDDAAAG